MQYKRREDYEIEDFLTDQSFINFHFRLDDQDEQSWNQWIGDHPDKGHLVEQAHAQIDHLSLSISENEYYEELEKMKKAITRQDVDTVSLLPHEQRASVIPWRKKVLRFAAVALAIAIASGILIYTQQRAVAPLTETVNNHSFPISLTLSDSTVVTLAPQSGLRYPLHFKDDARDVFLTGDAQFHVKRNERARFKVYSENLVATVLGTIFNFKKSGDSAVVIELLKGKLNVESIGNSDSSQSVLLYPNQKVTYSKKTHEFNKGIIEFRTNIAFEGNSFREVADKIKSSFGITLVNNSNKTAWRFTGDFKNASAKEVIDNICFVKNLSATIKGDSVFIK